MMLLPKTPRIRDRKHMERVAQLPCVVCASWPVQVHHCIHGRHSQRKASDTETIPLCMSCHDGLHRHPTAWKREHGEDHSYLPRVAEALRQMERNTV
jgi:hypothetical protein